MSKIEWTDKTWNPIVGCSKVSPACDNCYAEQQAGMCANFKQAQYQDVVRISPDCDTYLGQWNGRTSFVESQLDKPLKRKKPTKYFVCSMSDLFHESVPFEWVAKVFSVMALCPQHTFQVLTKRPERMAYFFEVVKNIDQHPELDQLLFDPWRAVYAAPGDSLPWPLPNVWIGTTVENQEQADRRIPHLLKCAAPVRFLSVEPMLGPVELGMWLEYSIQWVICGGEAGPRARPMYEGWALSLMEQCRDASIPFFFKQWGEWYPHPTTSCFPFAISYGNTYVWGHGSGLVSYRVGKKVAGRLLDGVEYSEFPEEFPEVAR